MRSENPNQTNKRRAQKKTLQLLVNDELNTNKSGQSPHFGLLQKYNQQKQKSFQILPFFRIYYFLSVLNPTFECLGSVSFSFCQLEIKK